MKCYEYIAVYVDDLGHVPMVILVCIVEMHTLNLLMCGYHLGTTSNYSIFWSMDFQLLWVFSLPRLNTPIGYVYTDFEISGAARLLQKKVHTFVGRGGGGLNVSGRCQRHYRPLFIVLKSLISLHPKKDCIIDIDCACGKFPMCLIFKYMFILSTAFVSHHYSHFLHR